MSRSFRSKPITGHWSSKHREKEWKRSLNGRLRAGVRTALRSGRDLLPEMQEMNDPGGFRPKDWDGCSRRKGKRWQGIPRRVDGVLCIEYPSCSGDDVWRCPAYRVLGK